MKSKVTPTHTKDWYIKWVATVFIISGMVATSQNLYPYNLFITIIGEVGWFIVALIWNDRALIVVTVIATFVYTSGIISWLIKGYV